MSRTDIEKLKELKNNLDYFNEFNFTQPKQWIKDKIYVPIIELLKELGLTETYNQEYFVDEGDMYKYE